MEKFSPTSLPWDVFIVSFFTVLHPVLNSRAQFLCWHIHSLTYSGTVVTCMFSYLLNTSSVTILFVSFFVVLSSFLDDSSYFPLMGGTRWQYNYPWKTDAHLAITNRLWRRTGCRSWYTGVIYILTADLRGSSKFCTSYSYSWQFVETEIWITWLGYWCYLTKP